ncbi:hypothetical protein DL93DRAFT_2072918 [Clavulina sp. PMI_390]|nr:hypothetical protein DL93DRAFT_2072918 [Clavulina sp. PMI_390]
MYWSIASILPSAVECVGGHITMTTPEGIPSPGSSPKKVRNMTHVSANMSSQHPDDHGVQREPYGHRKSLKTARIPQGVSQEPSR